MTTDLGPIILEFVKAHHLSTEALTERQLAEVIRQALMSGDFLRNVRSDGCAQLVLYLPWQGMEALQHRYNELINAVASKHEGESRHETALRYIREREANAAHHHKPHKHDPL